MIVAALVTGLPLGAFSQEVTPACGKPGIHEGQNVAQLASGMSVTFSCRAQSLHGPYEVKASNGTVLKRGQFWAGEPHGHWVRFWENGVKRDEGMWNQGKPVGLWKIWDRHGKLEQEKTFPRESQASVRGEKFDGGFAWSRFRVGGLYAVQDWTRASTSTVWIAALPSYRWMAWLDISLWVLGTVYRSAASGFSVVLDFGPQLAVHPVKSIPLWLEIGPGFEFLAADGEIKYQMMAGLEFRWEKPLALGPVRWRGVVATLRHVFVDSPGDLNIFSLGASMEF